MSVSFTILADPSPRAIARELRALGREFRTWRPAFRAMAPYLARGLAGNLSTAGGSIGAHWAPLRPDTLQRKARLGRDRRVLVGTGATFAEPLASGGAIKLSAVRMRIGVPSGKVAGVQTYGSRKRGIPARSVLGWTAAMQHAAELEMERYAREMLRRAADSIGRLR